METFSTNTVYTVLNGITILEETNNPNFFEWPITNNWVILKQSVIYFV